MGFRLTLRPPLDEDIRRVAREQLDFAMECLRDSVDAGRVHNARKRLKMLRAVVRLVRDPLGSASYADERDTFRDAGRRLSSMRDADVLISTLDQLTPHLVEEHRSVVGELRTQLTVEREAHVRGLDDGIAIARETLREARRRVDDWPLRSVSVSDLVDGFARTYARGRKALRAASGEPTDDQLHEWRKRAKDLWYHLRLLRESWPCVTAEWAAEAHRLTDRLGDDHDLAVLLETANRILQPAHQRTALDRLGLAVAGRRQRLQSDARALGVRMYAEKRRPLRRRMHQYLRASSLEQAVGSGGETMPAP